MQAAERHAAWIARCPGRGDLALFSEGDLAELRRIVGEETLPAGTPLMSEGEPVSSVGVIHAGTVELYRRSGRRRVVLHLLRAGDVYGDIPVLCEMSAPFSARVLSTATVTRMVPGTLWEVLEAEPQRCRRFLYSVASRLERSQRRLLELTAGDLRSQVATLLLDETAGVGGEVRLTQTTIAGLLGASRQAVNGVLKDLEREGALEIGYRRVAVIDPVQLADGLS